METNLQAGQAHPHKQALLPILFALDVLVLGGLTALLAVNRLLWRSANAYASYNMAAASVVLDLIDDLLAYLGPCAVLLFFCALITIAVAVWRSARSRTVRYGAIALVTVVFLLSATSIGAWVLQVIGEPSVPPVTPTPAVGTTRESPYGDAQTAVWTSATNSSTTIRRSASVW